MRKFLLALALMLMVSPVWAENVGNGGIFVNGKLQTTLYASQLAANGSNCSAGLFAAGVDAEGGAEGCTDLLAETELDSLAELNSQIADATVMDTASYNTISELDTLVADVTLLGTVDEDDMSSDSATLTPTQQSVKAYVDTKAGVATWDKCMLVQDLTSGDDDVSFGSFSAAVTIASVWCTYDGVGSTVGQISLEDSDGNAMTHTTPTCSAWGTEPTAQNVTSGGSLVAREFFAFDVDNIPDPSTDDYTICVSYSYD